MSDRPGFADGLRSPLAHIFVDAYGDVSATAQHACEDRSREATIDFAETAVLALVRVLCVGFETVCQTLERRREEVG